MKGSRKRAAVLVGISLILILALLPVASSLVQAAIPWTKIPGVSLGDEMYVVDAEVIKDGGTYEMWYTHGKTGMSITGIASSLMAILTDDIVNDIANLDLASLLSDLSGADINALYNFLGANSTVIGYATSPDGTTWTPVNPDVLPGGGAAWDSVGSPSVVKTGGSYQMWYTHASIDLTQTELQTILTNLANPPTRTSAALSFITAVNSTISYTTSVDGINWTAPQEVLAGTGAGLWNSVATPSVVRTDSSTYEMWYTNASTSLTQTDLDTMLTNISTFGVNELMSILNVSGSRIGYVTSSDGITWTPVNPGVLAGSGGVWDSVAAPSVIKTGSNYEMWYTRAETDLTSVEIQALITEIRALDLTDLWTAVKSGDLIGLFIELVALIDFDMVAIKTLLANSSGVVGHAVSSDGVSWQEQDQPAMVGVTGSPWSSIGAPCVIYSNGAYEMWFTQGIDQLTTTNLVAVLQGIILPIGYATFPGNSVELVSEWNFVGLPVSPTSTDIADVLAGIIGDVEIVWYFDGITDTWYYYIPGGPATLTQMTGGKGYWVKNTNPTTLGITGIEPALPYDIPLVVDWNLISLPETPSSSAIGDVLAGIIADVEIVWYYDGATATWSYYIPGGPPPTLNNMTEGKAYWIKMTNPNTLTIN